MNIIAIGARSNIKKNIFTGQSIMFDGVIEEFIKSNYFVKVIDISSGGIKKTIFRILEYILVLFQQIRYLLSIKFDIGYITTAQSKRGFIRDYLIISLFHLFKVKVVIHQYGANYNQLVNSLDKKGFRYLNQMLDRVSVIIVEGDHMKSQFSFLKGYEDKVKVIPNGLPSPGQNTLNPKTLTDSQPFQIFYLSNLIWSKGYFDVLEAVNILVNKYHKKINCIFAGAFMESTDDSRSGISNPVDFERFIRDNRLEGIVCYYPGLYGKEKDKIFASSNVFVLPTYYINEGQPVSILEAMSYGCVPIVTQFRHIPMMVNERNGCFVEPKCPEQIVEVILQLLENPELYKKKSSLCIEDYLEKFTFDKFYKQILYCIKQVESN